MKIFSNIAAIVVMSGLSLFNGLPVRAQSLVQLFEIADRESQLVRVSETGLKAADEAVEQAKSAMLPSVSLSLSGSYIGTATLMSRGFSTSGTTDVIVAGLGPQAVANGAQTTPHWGNSFTAQASQVVYAGGGIKAGIRMAELGKQISELDIQKNKQEVRFLIAGYYLDLCKLKNQQDVVEKNIELTEKVIKNMQSRLKEGTALKNDITRYELQLKSLELTRVKLQDAATIISHQIVTTLHMPADTKIMPDMNTINQDMEVLKSIASEQAWQEKAAENNIGIQQASVAKNLSDEKVKATRAASLPSVALVVEDNLFGPYTSDLIPVNANVNAWFVGFGVKYNLSSLWGNKHAIRKAKREAEQQQERVTLAREGVENGVKANYVNFLTAYKEVETQEKQVELADQNFSVVENRYKNQLALLTDMLDASNMKLSADMALINARISLLYSYYKLKYVSNTL